MPWLAVSFDLDAAQADAFGDALLAAGADSVTVEDAEAGTEAESPHYAEPPPGAAAMPAAALAPSLWRRNRIEALFAEHVDAASLIASASGAAGLAVPPPYRIERLADDDWVRRTQSQFAPLHVDADLWIVPSWHEPPDAQAVSIRLDPGLAFGTGSHPTTRLVLKFLLRQLREARARGRAVEVLDYGCGSGILAIAAAKLGAAGVDAVDLDPQALAATAQNALANAVAVRVYEPPALPDRTYDVVVANILTNPLIALAPLLAARTRAGGWLALAGVLAPQAGEVIAAYAHAVLLRVAQEDEGWVLLEGCRPPGHGEPG